jgi:ribosomal subunit interface protein
MTVRVSGKNLDIGEALRRHVLEKVEATVAHYFSGSVSGHVVMTREGSGYRSDCTLRLSSGLSLHAEGRAQVENYLIESPREEEEEPTEGFDPVVVAEGTEDLKSLSVASAVAELDLSGAPVIVFQHASSGRVNVVYRRRDGAIGWLDPQAPREPPRAV